MKGAGIVVSEDDLEALDELLVGLSGVKVADDGDRGAISWMTVEQHCLGPWRGCGGEPSDEQLVVVVVGWSYWSYQGNHTTPIYIL